MSQRPQRRSSWPEVPGPPGKAHRHGWPTHRNKRRKITRPRKN